MLKIINGINYDSLGKNGTNTVLYLLSPEGIIDCSSYKVIHPLVNCCSILNSLPFLKISSYYYSSICLHDFVGSYNLRYA